MPRAAFIDGYEPHAFNNFRDGLNLRDKADAVGDGEAIDLLNVDLTERGAMRQRDGFADFSIDDMAGHANALMPYFGSEGQRQLVAGIGPRLEAFDVDGLPLESNDESTADWLSSARFGDLAGHEYLYMANGIDTLRRWDGTVFLAGDVSARVNGVSGKAMPKAGAITVTASHPGSSAAANASNRLVATAFQTSNGGPGGYLNTTPSHVFFSNPGQPEVWETDGHLGEATDVPPFSSARGANWIALTPGDGERITAAVTWRELVFIFKQTKFFVLWGEGEGADGTPTFQVREVVNAIGLASPQAVTVGRDGIYFMNRRGVYRTNGGNPELISDVISPMWTQDPDVYFTSSPINLDRLESVRMLWHQERVYVAVPTGESTDNDRVLVYDTVYDWWSLYDIPAASLASFTDVASVPALFFGYAGPTLPPQIGQSVRGTHSDRGQRMRSYWRSGWGDYSNSQQKTIRETKVWGTGAAMVSFSGDFNVAMSASLDTLFAREGVWPEANTWDVWIQENHGLWPLEGQGQVVARLCRRAVRATTFSTKFANSPQAAFWSVHRVARHLREIREPSVR